MLPVERAAAWALNLAALARWDAELEASGAQSVAEAVAVVAVVAD